MSCETIGTERDIMIDRRPLFDAWVLDLCDHVARRSRDPSTQVGAAIIRPDKTVASIGYNGLPRGVRDDPMRYLDRPTKLAMVVHAEANAILSAREPVAGYTLYVSPLMPCAKCAALIVQSGINTVIARTPADIPDRWRDDMEKTLVMFGEAGVSFHPHK